MKAILLFFLSLVISVSYVNSQTFSVAGISEVKPLKRGSTYDILLTGGNESSLVILELLNASDNEVYGKWEKPINQAKVVVKIPSKIKSSSDYYFRISDTLNENTTTSDQFKIRRKIPLGIKLGAATVIPAVVLIAIFSDNEDDIPQTPDPPSPERR